MRFADTGRLVTFIHQTLWHLILHYLVPASYSNGQCCTLETPELTGISVRGDVLFGAVLPLHIEKIYPKLSYNEKPKQVVCKKLSPETFLQVQVVKFATMEINNSSEILPNITLGFQVYDSCSTLQRELEGTLWMLTGQSRAIPNFQCQRKEKLAAIIGHATSTYSILMAHILGLSRYPQISHFSTSSLLSDRTQFASFFRTVPSDAFQSKGLAQLVLHFGWTWVGLVALANDYGQQGIQVIKQEILKSGACVEFTLYIQPSRPNHNILQISQVIKDSTAQAIVVFSTDVYLLTILDQLLKQNITEKTWVASEAWSTSSLLTSEKYSKILAGTIGFAFYSGNIPGLKQYLDHVNPSELPEWAWNWMFWEDSVGCAFLNFENVSFPRERPSRNCTEKDKVDDFQIYLKRISGLRIVYNLYSAIFAVATALHQLSVCRPGNDHFINSSCSDVWNFKPWQILRYIKNVRVKLNSGHQMFFDNNGDPPPMYDIVNWQMNSEDLVNRVLVGQYDRTTLRINASALRWTSGRQKVPASVCSESCPPGFRKAALTGKPNCCFQCVPCPPGEITNQSDFIQCFKCPWDQWPSQRKDRCLPKLTEYLSYDETLGVILLSAGITSSVIPLAVLGILVYHKTTPIVRANNYGVSCLLLVSMSLCFLSSLAFIGYPTWEKCLLRQVTFGMVFALCVSCILAKTLMVMIAFKATKPNSDLNKWASPKVSYTVIGLGTLLQLMTGVAWLSLSPPFPTYNLNAKVEVLIVECNEGSLIAFWCTIGYLSLLALASFVVAFLSRQLPDSFNEARFITFSMLAFLSVWISYIPASLSTSGKYTVAMEVFAILSSSWAMLCFMFAPKCYVIVFRPSMNSRKHLLKKKKKGSQNPYTN
ncbi:PREDICTED: extracellular calcium-sensing receptor-like [Nanorana parkeri]|uniref:extracellular calcium-sensing receptor-like n=1 Tax=Nanorana parkeri TaxID=125878 RepID=UPI000854DEA6|nr:PREDICTED: extracellular calcium-sensing receptor-like [Nanorana parkeri]